MYCVRRQCRLQDIVWFGRVGRFGGVNAEDVLCVRRKGKGFIIKRDFD